MSKHTPGPWMVSGPSKPTVDSIHGGDYAIMDGGTNIIAETFNQVGVDSFRPAEANARLIAAAPELLGALNRLRACYSTSHSPQTRQDCWDQALAAIAKATGGTP